MGRIGNKFARLQDKGEVAFIPFLTVGDPDLETTKRLALEVVRAGADLLELGVPFSDPMADGPTLQRAAERALRSGSALPRVLEVVVEVRQEGVDVPIFLLGYYNPFFRYGLGKAAQDAHAAGVDGILCVDLPPEEADEFQAETEKTGIDLIFMLAPTSSPVRVQMVLKRSRGLVYCVSVTGITGARLSLPQSLKGMVEGVKATTTLPVVVGFGVSTPEQAAWVAGFADGVIVGSAIAQIIERHLGQPNLVTQVGEFVSSLKRAVEKGARG
ncbi:MAG: tryptophan synthase subunit alpha [Deltaproteobacteria bacterium]|nr:tryptophan synthase subunit alpha [Deltaproteobacteria bacterium]